MPPHGSSRGIPLPYGRNINPRTVSCETKGSTFAACVSAKRYDRTGLYCHILHRPLNSPHFSVKTFGRSVCISPVSYSYPQGQHLVPMAIIKLHKNLNSSYTGPGLAQPLLFFLGLRIQSMQALRFHFLSSA